MMFRQMFDFALISQPALKRVLSFCEVGSSIIPWVTLGQLSARVCVESVLSPIAERSWISGSYPKSNNPPKLGVMDSENSCEL